jgi:transcriptional regulator with AAA-type ATPase domain
VAQALHIRSRRAHLTVLDVATVMADGKAQWLRAARQALDDADSTVVVQHLQLCDAALAAAVTAEIDRARAGARLVGTLITGSAETERQSLLDRFCLRLEVPPLRDRREDVEALVRCFVSRHASGRSLRFHPEAVAVLRSADLPGNVRQLERVVAGLAAARRGGDILPVDLPVLGPAGPSHLSAMERAERDAIVKALREVDGNKAAAAIRLGISRPTLYRKLIIYGIEPA